MEEDFQAKRGKPSKAWYLLPIFLGPIGGIIAYFLVKDRDKKMAEKLLIVGVVMIVVYFVLQFILLTVAYMFLSRIPTTVGPVINIVSASCTDGTIEVVIRNEGTDATSISSIDFYVDDQLTSPSGCFGDLDLGKTASCTLGTGLTGDHMIRVTGPRNVASGPVSCT